MSNAFTPLAARYAKALLAHAHKGKAVAETVAAAASLQAAFSGSPALVAGLANIPAGEAARTTFAVGLGKSLKAPKPLADVFRLLAQHDRMGLLPEVLAAVQAENDAAAGTVRVAVSAAVPLSAAQRKSLEEYVQKATKAKDVVLEETQAPDLLGGFRAFFAGKVLDASVRGRLTRLTGHLKSINS